MSRKPLNPALRSLTLAALALPGLCPSLCAASSDEEASFQYGHYSESRRDLFNTRSGYQPIAVDNLYGSTDLHLTDHWHTGFKYQQDTWSGATPIASAPIGLGGNNPDQIGGASPLILGNGTLLYDAHLNPYRFDLNNGTYQRDRRLVHTIASASPETRKQGNFSLGYGGDEAAVNLGGGLSEEPDYHSAFASLGGRMDLNQKNTSLDLNLSYTHSNVTAKLDPEASTYYDYSAYTRQIATQHAADGSPLRTLEGLREDWAARFGLSQILSKTTLVEASLGYTRSTGFQENPYKVVDMVFIDPSQAPLDMGQPGLPLLLAPDVRAVLEQRPDQRNQWIFNTRYVQYVRPLDAALHLGYRYYRDDWGIDAHTFDADWGQPLGQGWTLTPRVRYYSQSAADFYRPYFLFKQQIPLQADNDHLDWARMPEKQYSSDHRLSGYGVLSGGITVNKALSKAVSLEAGFEYYTHKGDMRLDGKGEGRFADFDFLQYNGALRINLDAVSYSYQDHGENHHHTHHQQHEHGHAPSGVMFDHLLTVPNSWMIGYRYMYGLQDGSMLHGVNAIADRTIIDHGCVAVPCRYAPDSMGMQMHMLDIMYAPTSWLNLMLMPQFMDMDMELRQLDGAPAAEAGVHAHSGPRHHATGGVGDTGLYALFKLLDTPLHHWQAGLGFTAPTGRVDWKVHSGSELIHYGMQLGSGTWDFRPSLTYTGQQDRWFWGAQVNGTVHMENHNASGYALGDVLQSTAWGGYRLLDDLNASVRGIHTVQDRIHGQYNAPHDRSGPMDFPGSYGGNYWDVGFGLNTTLAGHQLGVEWLQPVNDDVNGYQLERAGSLYATWSLPF